tara:strand:- start:1634 stop:2794 length:1161 start_codon:yes stop_codon:yes gene_type:complete
MNIHEHQAKELFKKYKISVPNGFVIFNSSEIKEKIKKINSKNFVIKAQIHAGGRGKAGGIKLVDDLKNLVIETEKMFKKTLVTKQTGSTGKKVNRIYIEEGCDVIKEFYLSCLVDRTSSKIAFISSAAGGMDIEKISETKPEKITTIKVDYAKTLNSKYIEKIIKPFKLTDKTKLQAYNLVQSIYKILLEKDANLIEINPLILTNKNELLCLDAKINFDDNALFRHPDIKSLKDFSEENPIETEAGKYDLAYIKLNGKIGCMVNGAGLAMATMDIIKLYGSEPANFLDVGGGASKEKVSAAFKIILSDKNVKGILINIFGGIMRCDVLAQGVVEAAKKIKLNIPLVVRLAGTNVELGKDILKKSNLKIVSADDLSDAAKKIIELTK